MNPFLVFQKLRLTYSCSVCPELSEPAELARFENIILTRPIQLGRPVVAELRSQCDMQKTPIDVEYSASSPRDLELDVRVHVEQSVAVEYDQLSKERLIMK